MKYWMPFILGTLVELLLLLGALDSVSMAQQLTVSIYISLLDEKSVEEIILRALIYYFKHTHNYHENSVNHHTVILKLG